MAQPDAAPELISAPSTGPSALLRSPRELDNTEGAAIMERSLLPDGG